MAPHRVHGLAGGAKLVTDAMPERLSASLVLMFGGGSRLEDERHAGVSHFIEHLFFKGTQRRPTSKEIADAIEGVGGFITASTDKELTAYWTRVPAEHTALGLDVLLDIVSNSKLAPADVERERMVILEELRMYQDQPQDFVQNLFEEIMWPGHPLGRDIAGTEESVSRLTRDDILEYASTHYRLPNLVMGAAGAIDDLTMLGLVNLGVTLPAEANGRLRLELESTNGVSFWLAYQQLLMGSIKTIDDEIALIDVITADDVRRVANEVLRTPIQMAVIGPFAKDAPFRAALGT